MNRTLWMQYLVLPVRGGRVWTFFLIAAAMVAYFSTGDNPELWRTGPAIFFSFFIAYVIPASDFTFSRSLAAFDSLAPHLALDEEKKSALRRPLQATTAGYQSTQLATGGGLGVAHNLLILSNEHNSVAGALAMPADNWLFVPTTVVVWMLLVPVVTTLVHQARLFARLAQHVSFDLLDTRRLVPFSWFAVSSTLVLVGAQAGLALLFLQPDINYATIWPGFFAIFLPMLVIFLTPLLPVRKRIKLAKAGVLDQIQQQVSALQAEHGLLPASAVALSRLDALLGYRREIRAIPEWPFETPVLLRLLLYLVIPPLTWIGAALIERLVDSIGG